MNSKQVSWQDELNKIKKIPSDKNHMTDDFSVNNGVGLNVVLTRQVEVKRYPVIAELTFKRKRPDLVSLLKAAEQRYDAMPARLIAYLKREQLLDTDSASVTPKGEEVISTGCIDVKERGLYHIWYTANDPLLGIRPLMIQRDTAFFDPNMKSWKKGSDARNSGFGVSSTSTVDVIDEVLAGKNSKQSQIKLLLTALKPEVICSSNQSAKLVLEWKLGLEKSVVSLIGQLETLDFSSNKNKSKPSSLDLKIEQYHDSLDDVMGAIALEFDATWDVNAQRMTVCLDKIDHYPSAVQNFEVSRVEEITDLSVKGRFNTVQVNQLPLQPKDRRDAVQWHKAWLNHFHAKKYHCSVDMYQRQAEWLDHEAMASFNLSLKQGQELLANFSREGQAEAYWHVAAMIDLSPSQSKKLNLSITLMDKEQLSLKEFIRQLCGEEPINKMIYSDRYVYTNKQLRNLEAIARCTGNAEGMLMTLDHSKGVGNLDLPASWERQIIQKKNTNHGRYWVFIGSSHHWYWECSSGLDFIQNYDGETFTVAGIPTFTPKEEAELPQYLQHAIKEIVVEEGL
ncbi:hypothetical protein Q4508_07680 [Amphritea sp. 2_MG-2023]|uniref:hypothetical protein n=1 Tax=Amphritea TaxID=515417 RepID=UPI001C074CE7|nr:MULTISPECIES: hypothetical protein [Amphritea]MBU2964034.1 hypothetical protein [Amphritea atlantica]MDO6418434.1 hypothetical protein [Amphritea sp. 2_MG-2023]